MREKKYTRTVAVRVTEEEWQLIEYAMKVDGHTKPSTWVRNALSNEFGTLRIMRAQDAKRAEAAAKRAANKAAKKAAQAEDDVKKVAKFA